MNYIEEKITVCSPAKIIWKAWADKYMQSDMKNGLEVGKKRFVTDTKRGVKFKILDFKENESLTIVWYSALIKLVFFHHVASQDRKSLVTCRVYLKGFFSFIIKPLIASKIRKALQMSLQQFSRDLNGL